MSEQSAPEPSAYEKLSDRKRRYVDAYLGEARLCKTRAAIAAGLSPATADAAGCRLHKDPEVKAAIEERLQEHQLGADEVLSLLADHARVSMADFLTIGPRGSVKLDLKKAALAGKLHLVREYAKTKQGPVIKLVDSLAALQLIGKHHGLFTDKVEHTFLKKAAAELREMSDDELRALLTGDGAEAPGEAGS